MRAVENQSISRRSIDGGVWLLGRRLVANLIRLVAVAVLARHLSPGDFGLVALAQVLLQFSVLAADNGIGTYVICDRGEGREKRTSSAFWLNLAMTAGQLLLLAIATPFISHFYSQPGLVYLLAALAAVFVFQQLAVIPEALVRRKLEYQSLVIRDTACDFVSAGLSVGLALTGWGLWSLVVPQVILGPIRLVAILSIAKWRPQLHFGFRDWLPIGKYSAHLTGANFLSLVANDGDTVVVGKVLGTQALGYYSLAWQLSNIVGRNITAIASNIGLPAFALLEQNKARLQAVYVRMLRLLATISFPLLLGMFVLADDLIRLVYGPRWEPAVIVLRLFIIFTLVRSVTSLTGVIYSVTSRPDISFKITIGFLPFYLAAVYLGSRWGIIGVAVGVTGVRTIGGVIDLYISTRLIRLSFPKLIRALLPAGVLALTMSALVWGGQFIFEALGLQIFSRLLTCSALGALFYGTSLALFDPEAYAEIAKLLSTVFRPTQELFGGLFRSPHVSEVRRLR